MVGEAHVVIFKGGLNDEVVGLVGLDDGGSDVEMPATDATDDLGEELEGAFGSGKIRERKPGVSLNNADRGEVGEIEATSESLGANQNVDFAVFDVLVEAGDGVGFFVITIEAGGTGVRKEVIELGFE